ncbi:unnamed protein product, partial [Hymenolepis diminuta]
MLEDPYGFERILPDRKIRFVASHSSSAKENVKTNGETSFNLSRMPQHYPEDETEQVSTYLFQNTPDLNGEMKNSLMVSHAPSEQHTLSMLSGHKSPPEDRNLPSSFPPSEDAP